MTLRYSFFVVASLFSGTLFGGMVQFTQQNRYTVRDEFLRYKKDPESIVAKTSTYMNRTCRMVSRFLPTLEQLVDESEEGFLECEDTAGGLRFIASQSELSKFTYYMSRESHPRFHQMLDSLRTHFSAPPAVVIVNPEIPGPATAYFSDKFVFLQLGEEFLSRASDAEVLGVFAHEMSHWKHGHSKQGSDYDAKNKKWKKAKKASLFGGLGVGVGIPFLIGLFLAGKKVFGDRDFYKNMLVVLGLSSFWLVPVVSIPLIVGRIKAGKVTRLNRTSAAERSRAHELEADQGAAQICPEGMISFLKKHDADLDNACNRDAKETRDRLDKSSLPEPLLAYLKDLVYQSVCVAHDAISGRYSTHPLPSDRIRAIKEYVKKMDSEKR